jgi:type IV pilus assembly protein PilP
MTRRRNSRKIAFLLLAFIIGVAGCKKEEKAAPSPATKPAQQVVQKQMTSAGGVVSKGVQKQPSSSKGQVKAIQQQSSSIKRVAINESQIDFSNRKDPFKPFIVQPVMPAKKGVSPANQNALPIQSFDVNKFMLAGIIAGLKENRALIVDPYRKGYVVKAGMLLGNNNGRITKISNNAVEVLEQFRDDNGILRKRTVRLVLPQKK